MIIYYKNSSVSSPLTKNDQTPPPTDLQKTNLIYEFTCPIGDCERLRNSYVGLTTTSLARRFNIHRSDDIPKTHVNTVHNLPTSRETLVENNKIPRVENDVGRLQILEVLLIYQRNPSLISSTLVYQEP